MTVVKNGQVRKVKRYTKQGIFSSTMNDRKRGHIHELKNDAVDIAKRNTAIAMKIANLSLDSV